MDEALGSCARSCCSGCPHSEAHGHSAAPVAGGEADQAIMLSVAPAVAELQERPRRARPPVSASRKGAGIRSGAVPQHVHAPNVV